MHTIARHSFADPTADTRATSRGALWTGRILSALAVLFLVFASTGKLLQVQPVIDGTLQLGFPRDMVFRLGVVLLSCVVVYVIPRTSPLGAVLLTGYLGGAVAAQARLEHPLFSHTLFPVYVAALAWGGLAMRDARLRAFLPWRGASERGRGGER